MEVMNQINEMSAENTSNRYLNGGMRNSGRVISIEEEEDSASFRLPPIKGVS